MLSCGKGFTYHITALDFGQQNVSAGWVANYVDSFKWDDLLMNYIVCQTDANVPFL